MHDSETVLSVLTDPRDRVLLLQNPILPMPRFGTLPELQVGERRYVAADATGSTFRRAPPP